MIYAIYIYSLNQSRALRIYILFTVYTYKTLNFQTLCFSSFLFLFVFFSYLTAFLHHIEETVGYVYIPVGIRSMASNICRKC